MNKDKIKKILEENKFSGFPLFGNKKGKFWQYPKIMENWWYILTGSEQKCLDFILRRTWGFKKEVDAISESQFMKGVKSTDKGTGLSKKAVINGVRGLIKKGFVELAGTRKDTKRYKLVLETNSNAVQETNNSSLESEHLDSANNEQVGSSENEHTIEDVTIEDITIDNIQIIYTIKKEIIPLYVLFIVTVYKLIMIRSYSRVHEISNQCRDIIYKAMEKYGPRNLLKAIINKSNDEWWREHNSQKSITWFFSNKDKIMNWADESDGLDCCLMFDSNNYGSYLSSLIVDIIKLEGKDNIKKIFREYDLDKLEQNIKN